jgi:transcriptional regulator with XRE-family HTH domain
MERDQGLIALGRAIRQAREERGMTPAELADAASGVERERLEALEAGRLTPDPDLLLTLGEGLGIDPGALVSSAGYLDASAVIVAFGRRLRDLRVEHSLSQDDLAHRTGIHATAIGRFERGGREPRLTTILRIAWGLGVLPGGLLDGLGSITAEAAAGATPSHCE